VRYRCVRGLARVAFNAISRHAVDPIPYSPHAFTVKRDRSCVSVAFGISGTENTVQQSESTRVSFSAPLCT